ncbi:uncharacterized protein [Mytilus edulis]|uniref:uncharacterized protein n=1 Tax=Mytilus edulis TaxID=6550 RepID=UPI0039EF766A
MYFGTQNANQCFCGDDPYQYGPGDVSDYYLGDYDCDKQCCGDSEQICGGRWRLSVYETGYLPLKQGHIQYKLFLNSTILTAPANQVMTSSSNIDCALYCKILDSCKVYVISTETGQCSLYNSYTIMCEGVQQVDGFQVYMMK